MKMKIIQFILVFLIGGFLVSCENNNNSKIDTEVINNPKSADGKLKPYEKAQITFNKTEHDFGKIIQGELVKTTFRYTNTGKVDLLISKVSTTCGCTVADYTRDPVKPGKKGTVDIIFDSRGKKGHQNKTVTVLSNATSNRTTLRVKANIVQPEK